ncbi:MAG: peptidoglycan-binding domain-containing protein, partial [Pseudomonadota bacterium]
APPSEGTMIDGIIKNMVGTLSEGLPLYTESTTTVTMMGRAQPPNRSISVVTGLRERRLSWDDCGVPPTPAGYRMTDMGAQISQAMGGADAAGMPSNEDMAEIMRQYEEAMAGMTDEERDILAQFGGADALRQGMPGGGAVPGTPPPSTRGAATSGAMVGATSAGLMGGNVEESVSNHLQALGYDTGNGASAALMTSIAISQYQAERGMPVTGEASQQLLDELAKAVP